MLITRLKPLSEISQFITGKNAFVTICYGCEEVYFPYDEVTKLTKEIEDKNLLCTVEATYLCNPDFSRKIIETRGDVVKECDIFLVFSCGVGVQTVSAMTEKPVIAGCDTIYISGSQGLTPLEYDCARCGQCHLNDTAGICPLTACSKGLLNGPCGGAKNGKCEIDKTKDCGWEKIISKIKPEIEKVKILHYDLISKK